MTALLHFFQILQCHCINFHYAFITMAFVLTFVNGSTDIQNVTAFFDHLFLSNHALRYLDCAIKSSAKQFRVCVCLCPHYT